MGRKPKASKKGRRQTPAAAARGEREVVPSEPFAEPLQHYVAHLADLRRRGASEDSIRDAFLRFLRTAFPRLQEAEPLLLEKHIPALRVRGGYANVLYGDLIFECKRRLDAAGPGRRNRGIDPVS